MIHKKITGYNRHEFYIGTLDESLLVEEDDDNDEHRNRMKQICNPLLYKFLLQSPSFKRTPSPVVYQQPIVNHEEIVCSEEEPVSLPNTPSFQNVASRYEYLPTALLRMTLT